MRVDGVSTKVIGERLGRSQPFIQRLFLMNGPGLKVNIPVRKPRTGDKKDDQPKGLEVSEDHCD